MSFVIQGDTICAISSAAGPAARMIVRLSGPRAIALARQLAPDQTDLPTAAGCARFRIAAMPVLAWVYIFHAPRSYTGEDIVELHLPGNPLLARMTVDALIAAGARPAEPGEFTARAYFNGRIDLTAAEGVAATVSANSEREMRAARQLMAGELARRLSPVMDQLAEALALVEVGIDFTDEDVIFIETDELLNRITQAESDLAELVTQSVRFERLSHEPRIVLVGRPNAGKSTLLNALARSARAIASPVAGTTRDVLSAEVALPSGLVTVLDVAGLETVSSPPGATHLSPLADIEDQMQRRARAALASADLVVHLREAGDPSPPIEIDRPVDLVIRSKADIASASVADEDAVCVSAVTGEGMDELRDRLDHLAFGSDGEPASLALNSRHRQAIDEVQAALGRARPAAAQGAELAAMELREALEALGRILGSVSPDDLLGRIFARFCIGK